MMQHPRFEKKLIKIKILNFFCLHDEIFFFEIKIKTN